MSKDTVDDSGNVTVIAHLCIRDPDTGEVIVRKRDRTIEKEHAPKDD
jgi:hypothetical protein